MTTDVYVRVSDSGTVHETRELIPGLVNADFDANGELIGVEVLGAKSLKETTPLMKQIWWFVRDIATNYDHEGRDDCYHSCRQCKAEPLWDKIKDMREFKP